MIENAAPNPEAQAGTRAAVQVVSAARVHQLTSLAHRSAVSGHDVAALLRDPARSVAMVPDLVRKLSAAALTSATQGARVTFWERFARPHSPVLRPAAQSEGWRSWADHVVDRYN